MNDPDSRLGRLEGTILGSAVLAAGVMIGMIITKIGASRTGELGLDASIAQHHDAVLTAVALFVDVAFGTTVAPLLLLVICAVLWLRSRVMAVAIAVLTAAGWVSAEIGKAVVHRPRPPAATVHALLTENAADSYPSGHTAFVAAAFFALVTALVWTDRPTRVAWTVGLPVVAVLAFSRLYLGVHYLGDVIGSVVFAAASVPTAALLLQPWLTRLNHRHEPTAPRAVSAPTGPDSHTPASPQR